MLVRIDIPVADSPSLMFAKSDALHQLADEAANLGVSPASPIVAELRLMAQALATAARSPDPQASLLANPFIADRRLP